MSSTVNTKILCETTFASIFFSVTTFKDLEWNDIWCEMVQRFLFPFNSKILTPNLISVENKIMRKHSLKPSLIDYITHGNYFHRRKFLHIIPTCYFHFKFESGILKTIWKDDRLVEPTTDLHGTGILVLVLTRWFSDILRSTNGVESSLCEFDTTV